MQNVSTYCVASAIIKLNNKTQTLLERFIIEFKKKQILQFLYSDSLEINYKCQQGASWPIYFLSPPLPSPPLEVSVAAGTE